MLVGHNCAFDSVNIVDIADDGHAGPVVGEVALPVGVDAGQGRPEGLEKGVALEARHPRAARQHVVVAGRGALHGEERVMQELHGVGGRHAKDLLGPCAFILPEGKGTMNGVFKRRGTRAGEA